MPLLGSGEISIGGSTSGRSINLEFGRAAGATTSMSQLYRNGGIVGSGAPNVPTSGTISLSQFYGAANQFTFTISTNQTNANLRTLAVNAGWNQADPVVATIGSGVYVSSNSTGTPALTVNGSFPGGVQLVNNGFIVGRGGNGGNGSSPGSVDPSLGEFSSNAGTVGGAGGLALSVSSAISINNAGTIAGGGGGGGGGRGAFGTIYVDGAGGVSTSGGGGGGGGRSSQTNSTGGSAFGGAGTASAAGSGGDPPLSTNNTAQGYTSSRGGLGGAGGGWGVAGSSGGGHRVGAATAQPATGGGSAGAAVSGNSNITWTATGTRLGAIA